jgi:two-component system cell cycle response regulator DivK
MSKRILVIEDTEDNRQIIRDLLTSFDYELIEAVDGAEGVAMAQTHHPDLILMDIQLPVIDGYEATRRIRAIPELARVPIVAVTSYALSATRPRRGKPVATATSPSPSARANCWRKSANSSRNKKALTQRPRRMRKGREGD